jgi:hypothetical protein
MSSLSTPASPPSWQGLTAQASRAGWLLRVLLQGIWVVAPVILMWELVDENRTNTLFQDDWVYVPLYEKAKLGQLTAHDLFGGYLEHRPAIVRMLNIALTLVSRGDVSWQCIAGFLAVLITWLNCGWLLRRSLGGWDRIWLPWGLMGWVLFCPVQWQGFLWPSCMLVNLPQCYLTTALVVMGSRRLGPWLRFAGAAILAWLATYTYAPGLMLWVILPLAAACGYGTEDTAARKRFVLAWLVPMGLTLFFYFHNLKNEVEPAFAYGQGNSETAGHSIEAVLREPGRGLRFALVLLGSSFARGIFGPRADVAFWMGTALLLLALVAAWAVIQTWRRSADRQAALPFAILTGFAFGVAAMIAAGRAWASKDVGGALNNRYGCYACAFATGLIGLFAVLRRPIAESTSEAASHVMARSRAVIAWLTRPAAGVLCGLLVANWFYGAEMMPTWRYARLRGAVDVHFAPVLGQQQDRGRDPVQLRLAMERAATLNKLGYLERPQADSVHLDSFKFKGKLDDRLGRITGTDRKPDRIEIEGYALLTMHGRPPDAVLLTVRSDESPKPVIVDVALPEVLPAFLLLNCMKDAQFAFDDYRPRRCGQWHAIVKREQLAKTGKTRLEVWALNFENFTIVEIGEGVSIDG